MDRKRSIHVSVKADASLPPTLRQTLDLGGLGLWEMTVVGPTLDGATLILDPTLVALAGISPEAVENDPAAFFHSLIHPDDYEDLIRGIEDCIAGVARPYRFEHRVWDSRHGDWRWYVSFADVTETDGQGRPLRLSGALQQVHAWRTAEMSRRQAELECASTTRALNRERQRINAISEAADLGLWEYFLDTGDKVVNSAWAAIVGYSQEELAAHPNAWRSVYLPSELERARHIAQTHIDGETPLYVADFRLRHKDGFMVWAQERGRVVEWNDQGKAVRMIGILINTTKQRRAELDLLEKISRQEAMVDGSHVGSWDWRIPEDRLVVSSAYLRQLGMDSQGDETSSDHWRDRIHPEESDLARTALYRVVDGLDSRYAMEIRLRHNDGHYVTLFDVGRVEEWGPDGKPSRIVGAHYSAQQRTLVESADRDMMEVIAEQSATLEQQLNTRHRLMAEVQKRVAKLASIRGAQDESKLNAAMTGQPLPAAPDVNDPDKFAASMLQMVDFITKRMQWYVTVIDNIPFPVHVIDNNMRWLYMNAASQKSFPDARLGDTCGGTSLCDSGACVKHELEKGKTEFIATTLATGRTFQGHAAWLSDENGVRIGHLQIMDDITERLEKERELLQARDEARDSVRAKSQFLANMSHEIRTPMNAILGLCHLLLEDTLGDKHRDYISRIHSAATSLLRIINDILDFSKIDAGKMDMVREEFDLERVIEDCAELLSRRAQEKGLEVILDVPPRLPTLLVGDAARLSQILTNLLTNAVKFTDTGEITLAITQEGQEEDKAILRFQVRDTGIGLSADQIETLFDAFTQADSSTTRKYGGTGLGLAISKRLAEMMDGKIWCDSVPGVGSTFTFTAAFGLGSRTGIRRRRRDIAGMRVLAVDDNVTFRDVLGRQLRGMGLSVTTAGSGEEALRLVRTAGRRYDVVLMDWKLPGMNGVEAVRKIREALRNNPPHIIMITAYGREEIESAARSVGVTTILSKPMSPSTLFNAIMDTLGHTQHKKAPPPAHRSHQDMVAHLQGRRLLLAEDNEVNQLVARNILQNAGFEVEVARNGREAVDMVMARDYDLVLMDIQMPEMDGLEATRLIRSMPGRGRLPIVAMTANAMAGDKDASLQAGMDAHVSKPINVEELFRTLAVLISDAPDREPHACRPARS